jgi:hypothetical protein
LEVKRTTAGSLLAHIALTKQPQLGGMHGFRSDRDLHGIVTAMIVACIERGEERTP